MNQPFNRADLALISTAAAATGVSSAARIAALQNEEINGATDAATRFLEQPVVNFIWSGDAVYLNPTDLIALLSTSILLIRFLVWALMPLARWLLGKLHGKKESS